MKKVLLVKTAEIFHKDETPQAVPHGGLGYLASSLQANGFEVFLLDVLAEGFSTRLDLDDEWFRVGLSREELKKRIEQINPDFIGISAQFTSQHESLMEAVEDVKSVLDVPVIIGGIHATFMPKFVLSIKGVDYILKGEAEDTLPLLLGLLNSSETNLDTVPGLQSHNINNPVGCYPNVTKLPFPARELYPKASSNGDVYSRLNAPHGHDFDLKNLPYYEVLTSRGCNYRCHGCAGSEFAGPNRTREATNVLGEIDLLVNKFGMKSLAIIDDNFIQDKLRAITILKEMVRRKYNLNVTFPNGLLIRNLFCEKGRIDEKFIDLLRMAGATEIDLPIETANARIMESFLTKKYDVSFNLGKLCEALVDRGVKVAGYFMIGFPYETKEEMENTINLAVRLKQNHGLHTAWPFLVSPFPGSRFGQQINFSDDDDIRELRFRKASRLNSNLNKIMSPPELQMMLDEFKRRIA